MKIPQPPSPVKAGAGVMLGVPNVSEELFVRHVFKTARQIYKENTPLASCKGIDKMNPDFTYPGRYSTPNPTEMFVAELTEIEGREALDAMWLARTIILANAKVCSVHELWYTHRIYMGWFTLVPDLIPNPKDYVYLGLLENNM